MKTYKRPNILILYTDQHRKDTINSYRPARIGKLHFQPHSNRDHKTPPASHYGFDTFILSDEPECYDDAYIKWVEIMGEFKKECPDAM